MTLADSLKPALRRIRSIPGILGLRPYRIFVRKSQRNGDFFVEGDLSFTEVEITNNNQPPKVKQLNDEQLAIANLSQGAIEVGPITPAWTDGGISLDDVSKTSINSQIRFKVVSPQFPDGAFYSLHSLKTDRSMHYLITLFPEGDID